MAKDQIEQKMMKASDAKTDDEREDLGFPTSAPASARLSADKWRAVLGKRNMTAIESPVRPDLVCHPESASATRIYILLSAGFEPSA